MSHHVFAWVAGFGWTLMPNAPFRFERVAGRPRSVSVEHFCASGAGRVVVTVSDDDRRVRSEPARQIGPPVDVVELIEGAAFEHWAHGAAYDHWRVETYPLSVSWPDGFAVDSVEQLPPPAFYLVGPDDARIWVQGPLPRERVPPLDRMEGLGQTTERIATGIGGPLVELRYVHDGGPWRMFHCVVERDPRWTCVVTAQTPERWREFVQAAVEEVAASLTPSPPE
jgi:hypothetical protein